MTRLLRNKKALSPVISTVLMILVVMVGMSVAFSAIVFYSDNYKSGMGSSVLESLKIEDIWITPSTNNLPNTVNITVYNVGTKENLGLDAGVPIKLATIYVNGVALNNLRGTIDFNDVTVNPGSHVTIEGQLIQGFQPGQTYTFKIVTERGSNFEAQATCPKS